MKSNIFPPTTSPRPLLTFSSDNYLVGGDYAHLASKWFIIKARHKVITDMPRSCPSHCGSILSAFPSISKTTKLVRVAPHPSPRVRKNLGGHAVNWRLIKICVSKGFLEERRTNNKSLSIVSGRSSGLSSQRCEFQHLRHVLRWKNC